MLFNTALGRLLLVALIIATSYTNKILGVVSVLLIIIAFSTSGIMEGMEHAMDPTMTTTTATTQTMTTTMTTMTTMTTTMTTTTATTRDQEPHSNY